MRLPLAKSLRARGFLVSFIGAGGKEKVELHDFVFYYYPLKREFSPIDDMKSIFTLWKILRKQKFDVVHVFDTKPCLLLPLASLGFGPGLKIVRTITGMGYIFSTNEFKARALRPIYHTMQKIIDQIVDATVFQNRDDKIYFQEKKLCMQNKRTYLVRSSGLDVDEFLSPFIVDETVDHIRNQLMLRNTVNVIMVSRLVSNKGVQEYLSAARRISRKHDNVRFLLVGSRETEGSQAVPLSLLNDYSDVVTCLGHRTDIRELLSLSHLFVLPSYYREGVPRVLLEAGVMGLPLITTDMPGCREVVVNGWNGYLVEPRSVSALVSAIEKILFSNDLGREMGLRNIKHIKKNFDLEIVSGAYINIYNDTIYDG
jgi:glycosyltransferase involved in cell wall biosynthesis